MRVWAPVGGVGGWLAVAGWRMRDVQVLDSTFSLIQLHEARLGCSLGEFMLEKRPKITGERRQEEMLECRVRLGCMDGYVVSESRGSSASLGTSVRHCVLSIIERVDE